MSRWICLGCDEPNGAQRSHCNMCGKLKPESAEKEPSALRWEVIGGADKGGILVRTGQELSSPQCSERLSTYATLDQQALVGERLHYRLLSGFGPTEGWVSIRLKDKILVRPVEAASSTSSPIYTSKGEEKMGPPTRPPPTKTVTADVAKEEEEWKAWSLGRGLKEEDEDIQETSARKIMAARGKPYTVLGLEPGASSGNVRRAYHMLALLHHPDKGGDEVVFKAIAEAYKALSEAKDAETGGWRDLEGQAVGPWDGHPDMGTKGVTACLFDTFGAPPWESRRLYTGGYLEGNIKCWELSKSVEPGVAKAPRLVGEIAVGGFINDVVALSSFGLLTAQSAGMKPLPGESLRAWNLKKTPFKPVKRERAALADSGKQAAIKAGSSGGTQENSSALVTKSEEDDADKDYEALVKEQADGYLGESEMIYCHYRGVRVISLWPRPAHRESVPVFAATVSKDVLGLSKIRSDGLGLQAAGGVWKIDDPHELVDINCMLHETVDKLWTGDNGGLMKCWDCTRSGKKDATVMEIPTSCGWVSGMVMWANAGCLAVSHSSGIAFIDMRAGKMIRQQYTNSSVGKIAFLDQDSPHLFAGVGKELNQYDTRCWRDGIDYKPKVVGQWSLGQNISSVASCVSGKGHLLIAVGCLNGRVAAFDTT